ncbi:MAG: hypothetical protein AABY22_16155 [Nanoarchaeota archaeon]
MEEKEKMKVIIEIPDRTEDWYKERVLNYYYSRTLLDPSLKDCKFSVEVEGLKKVHSKKEEYNPLKEQGGEIENGE